MDLEKMQQNMIQVEIEAEHLLLARHQLLENEKLRNGNREALTALRKKARQTSTPAPESYESIMREIQGLGSKPLVMEVCQTCGTHDPKEVMWMTFPGTEVFACIPFHAAHTILERDQALLDYDTKKLQSYVKEKTISLSEKGAIGDIISPGLLGSHMSLTDMRKDAIT